MYSEKSIHEYEKSPYCIYSGKSSSYSKNTLIDCVCVSVSMLGGGGGRGKKKKKKKRGGGLLCKKKWRGGRKEWGGGKVL